MSEERIILIDGPEAAKPYTFNAAVKDIILSWRPGKYALELCAFDEDSA